MAMLHHGSRVLVCHGSKAEVVGETESPVLISGRSRSGKLVATVDEKKTLRIHSLENGFVVVASTAMEKRATALCFDLEETAVVCADKTGDFYRFQFTCQPSVLECIGGHVSMLLDLVVTRDGKYVVTGDRDSKVRVSRYPDAHVVESFCLGHEDNVTAVADLPGSCLVSGSGDGTLRLWDAMSGSQLHQIETPEVPRKLKVCPLTNIVVALFKTSVGIFRSDNSKIECTGLVNLSVESVDMAFDDQGSLWVLTRDASSPIVLLTSTGDAQFEKADNTAICEPLKDLNLHEPRPEVEYNVIQIDRKGDDEQDYFKRKRKREEAANKGKQQPQK